MEASRASGYTPDTAWQVASPLHPHPGSPTSLLVGVVSAARRNPTIMERKMHIKDKTFAFRISETDYLLLKSKAAAGQITMTELILRSVIGKKIIVIDGLKEVLSELKSIGRNLNQLTTLCNMGRINTLRLDDVKQDFAAALDKILALTGERN